MTLTTTTPTDQPPTPPPPTTPTSDQPGQEYDEIAQLPIEMRYPSLHVIRQALIAAAHDQGFCLDSMTVYERAGELPTVNFELSDVSSVLDKQGVPYGAATTTTPATADNGN